MLSKSDASSADHLLMSAAKFNDVALARQAIELGAGVNQGNEENSTPIHIASENGFDVVVKLLANYKEIDLSCQDIYGFTALALAITMRHLKVVTILLEAGANPNQPSILHSSPVHLAVSHSAYFILKELIRFGAKVNLTDCFGRTPLCVSIFQTQNFKITQFLLDSGANPNFKGKTMLPLLSEVVLAATDAKMLAIVQLLISHGAEIDEKDDIERETALHKAAVIGYEPVLSFLVSKGADLDAVNARNMRPYDIAVLHFNKKAAETLNHLEFLENEANLRLLSASRRSKKMRLHL